MSTTTRINYRSAIRFALREELKRDNRVFLIGEDVASAGGVFKVTEGLFEEFGEKRIIDTPISETAIIGSALGAALMGLIPIAELMFSDFSAVAMDQIVNQIAKYTYMSGGQAHVGLVIRAVTGGGISFSAQHSQSLEAWFAHTPGLVSLMPSNPRDAKGLLKSAIRSGKPVMFFEHKALYSLEGDVPESEELIPFGKSEVKKDGSDVTLVGASATVHTCLDAASKLEADGIHAEVIDLRSLYPLDSKTILSSVEKTGRLVVVEEDVGFCGWGAEIVAQVSEGALYSLKAPVKRVSAPYSPIPFSTALETLYMPSADKVHLTTKSLVRQG
ncbi:MAG: alpha-ketoacid dehydrogenase subunit beta [Nitrososphaerales archaeon]